MREEYWEDLLPEDQEMELAKRDLLEEEKIGYEFAQRANILYSMFKYREIMFDTKFNGVVKLWQR